MSIGGIAGGLFGKTSTTDKSAPIELVFKSAKGPSISLGPISVGLPSPPVLALGLDGLLSGTNSIKTFDSYYFERNMLNPGAPFRFTAPGVDKSTRMSIRSGDTVQLIAIDKSGSKIPIAVGFVDETDTHISPSRVEYVITGRDTLGQLIDNAAVNAKDKIIFLKSASMETIFETLIENTRMPQEFDTQGLDNSSLLFQTNPGETKMNVLQRYMELTNSLVWTNPNGQATLGKPSFIQPTSGIITVDSNDIGTNVLDCRVRRNLNNSIRAIVTQLQTLDKVDAKAFTVNNTDSDMQSVYSSGVGRSVYRVFTFGEGSGAVNILFHIPNTPGNAMQVGAAYSNREIARENVQVLDVEITLQGHLNSQGEIYDVDQTYFVNIPDEQFTGILYVYSVTHELSLDHGMITKLRLCKQGTLVANVFQLPILGVSL